MATQKVIVIGASAGGIEALRKILSQLPENFPAAIFITQHLYQRSETILPDILGRAGRLPVRHPAADEPIVSGQIYLAPPDYHLVFSPGVVRLGHGPKENLQRPCINVMFRSAAAAYGPNVIGVLITGMLDDGASGLWEIKERGGVTIVQDPEEAAYRSMPESAIRGFQVDHIVRLDELGSLLGTLVSEGASMNVH
jgi:two-component system chemotaxis response regulator CheB